MSTTPLPPVKSSKTPRSLRELAKDPGPHQLMAHMLLYEIAPLRMACFLDNEYGKKKEDEVGRILCNVSKRVSDRMDRSGKRIQLNQLDILTSRHHHIHIDYVDCRQEEQCVLNFDANVYERSRRPEDEEEERVGPRRGPKALQ